MFAYVVPLLIGLLIISALYGRPYWVEFRRAQIRRQPFPAAWRQIIKQRLPYFNQMPTDLQLQLKKHIQIFIVEKEFVGYQDLIIDDDIKVTIAAQACLLLLNRKTDYYPGLRTIAVYPDAFIKNSNFTDAAGVFHPTSQILLGESWQLGRVVLSWKHSIEGAKIPNDGANVVIHEFAHQLDQESGSANGAPILTKNSNYQCWSTVFEQEYRQLQQQTAQGLPSLFNHYGATNPAEFFAVATEVFFEQAAVLFDQHNSLYHQLKSYYQVDPVNWQ